MKPCINNIIFKKNLYFTNTTPLRVFNKTLLISKIQTEMTYLLTNNYQWISKSNVMKINEKLTFLFEFSTWQIKCN